MNVKEIMIANGIQEWLDALGDVERAKEVEEKMGQADFRDFFGKPLGTYDFEEGKGICGILLGTGQFLKCRDTQHTLLASMLNRQELFLSIFFSSELRGDDMSVFTHNLYNSRSLGVENYIKATHLHNIGVSEPLELSEKVVITDKQLDFIEKNYRYMDVSLKESLSVHVLGKIDGFSEFDKSKLSEIYHVIKM